MRKNIARSFLPAAWLGWQIESNWADPLMFFIFSIIKPIASVLILVFMYNAVAQVSPGDPIFAYIYLGNAFYIYVGAVIAGTSFSIIDDRERYRSLKYIYIAPISIPIYLVGRAVARFVIGTMAVIITLGTGMIFFQLPINLLTINWLLLFGAMGLGVLCMVLMGIALGMWTLTLRTEPWFLGEALAASLYLFSGAIFPISILPTWLQPLGYLMPISYWLELIRRALLGSNAGAFPTFAAFSNAELFGILGGITLLFGVIAAGTYKLCDRIAREKGMIDTVSNF